MPANVTLKSAEKKFFSLDFLEKNVMGKKYFFAAKKLWGSWGGN